MTYARARLLLGITGVGTWVLIALAGILWQWGTLWSNGNPFLDLAAWLFAYVLVQLPFDCAGGYLLPKRWGRPTVTFAAWLKGTLVHAAVLLVCAGAVLFAGQAAGLPGALATVALLMTVAMLGQSGIAHAVGRLRTVRVQDDIVILSSFDPAFAGGWVGFGSSATLLMPARWQANLQAVQRVRRQATRSNGSRIAGILLAALFNLAGFGLSYLLTPGAGFASVGQYLHLIFGFTLWSFLGLLLLPSLSRPAVFLADRFAEQQGVSWLEAAQEHDKLQDDEPARTKWIERIFHPVPSLASRQLRPSPTWGAWQAARIALYLSWTVPGLLARSVHCNVGRPDLWVLFPAD